MTALSRITLDTMHAAARRPVVLLCEPFDRPAPASPLLPLHRFPALPPGQPRRRQPDDPGDSGRVPRAYVDSMIDAARHTAAIDGFFWGVVCGGMAVGLIALLVAAAHGAL